MAEITITIPDDQAVRVRNALCDSVALPRTAANARGVVVRFIRDTVRNTERTQAVKAAMAQVAEPADPGVT